MQRGGRGAAYSRSSYRGATKRSYGNSYTGSENSATPSSVVEIGSFVHSCEGQMVYQSTNEKIPHFNAPIFLENKSQIGKLDEILGPINQVYFSVKPVDGVVSTSFKTNDKVFISEDKLLPMERFLPKPKAPKGARKPSGYAGRGGASRGSFRGSFRGRGAPSFGRGGPQRGGSFGRGGGPRGNAFRGGRFNQQ